MEGWGKTDVMILGIAVTFGFVMVVLSAFVDLGFGLTVGVLFFVICLLVFARHPSRGSSGQLLKKIKKIRPPPVELLREDEQGKQKPKTASRLIREYLVKTSNDGKLPSKSCPLSPVKLEP